MMSCVHLEKKRGLVNWEWYFGERMETFSVCEKDKKRKECRFSVCSFAHLLCVHIVFEHYFVGPFFFFFLLGSHLRLDQWVDDPVEG